MIDYQNITDNEIRRIVSCAADPAAQVQILADLTCKKVTDIKKIAGVPLTEKEEREMDEVKLKKPYTHKWGWSDAEIRFLLDNPDMKNKDIRLALGRSFSSIAVMRSKLGIKKNSGWSEEETNKLIELLGAGLSLGEAAAAMDRKYGSIAGKVQQLREKGVIMYEKKWTKA